MQEGVSKQSIQELTAAVRKRYRWASKKDKTRILDEFVAMSDYHRKHAIRLLGLNGKAESSSRPGRKKIYDEAVKEALIILWEAADRICGKRLKAILPTLIEAMERAGHLDLDPEVRTRLLQMSASTIDRLLAPIRSEAKGRKKRRRSPSKVSKQIPVKTFSDWDQSKPGELEMDFVVHCGSRVSGTCIHSLGATCVCSGWTEAVPLLAREQSLAVEGLDIIRNQFPVPVLGLNPDNDSAFINETLASYCEENNLRFTRSRPYQKNDQAWIEQKNGAVIRRFVGYDRFSGVVAGQLFGQLYQAVRLYVNYFQPSFKLREKTREGSRVIKKYYKPATPCERLLEHKMVTEEDKEALRYERSQLDPIELLHRIRESQAAMAAISTPESSGPERQSLDEFLSQLPRLWRLGEVRPTHRKAQEKPRYWRTRKDPFEGVWPEILGWLQENPDVTAKLLFDRLMSEYPGKFESGQLRTLQRRVKEWRHIMARELVFACSDPEDDLVPTCR
ncbi:MAG: DDE-type integrase/transposase/recombinase [Actinobacteria bacterium]|nr:DDE-type integrase/transposase/recombinase [Actinomycetota bacterium]MBU4391799.1 DDE-type integrase/transposase/recombinase [Actinomycetota bacterium]MBU4403480.1 DDE-type integrase/transposase/recombinase [Actinomycetota bacterium]MCG2818165.1 transposase [Actinomycetes bacterium]